MFKKSSTTELTSHEVAIRLISPSLVFGMSSLEFYIWTPWYAISIDKPFLFTELQVEGAEISHASDKPSTFRSTALIHDHDTRVYRGLFTRADGQEIMAVCKLFCNAGAKATTRFRNEAKIYQTKLRDLQGRYIPRFYGLYSGDVFGKVSMCMILEDCGESIASRPAFSIAVIRILMAIHERGVRHNDFDPRNVVVDNIENPTRLVVIDFEHATDHECRRGLDLKLYTLPPPFYEFNCDELYDAAVDTAVWTPDSVYIFGGYVSVHHLTSPEELLKYANAYDDLYTDEEAIRHAKAVIRDFFKKWESRKEHLLGNTREVLSSVM
ncbi:hypothetical protein NM688_g7360 [Phlebia brevispora]|uniref:Uncharacterized protein n=1 Tax=Phlebia brevispora TaxID=194682 RepID=A0ACC1S619_9APHY|nr:hypothetical protein NM688_g7360 [Phlebia brevispora]